MKVRMVLLAVAMTGVGALARQFIALPLVQQQVLELTAAQQRSMATYLARDVDASVNMRLALIGQLASELPPALMERPHELNAWLHERHDTNTAFGGGLLALRVDGSGLIAAQSTIDGFALLDFTESSGYRAALRDGRAVMGRPMRSHISGEPIVAFTAPVFDAAGQPVMVLAGIAKLDGPGFLSGLQHARLGETGGFSLISPQDRLIVASSDRTRTLTPVPAPGSNLLLARAMRGYRGTDQTISSQGVEQLASVVSVPSTGWFMVAYMPTAEAFRPVQALRTVVTNVSGILLVVMLLILAIALPRIFRPLTDAARAMRDMANGRRELTPLPIVRDDEVGNLIAGFNVLVAKLQQEQVAREASEARLAFLAHHDSLTGLYNRAMLQEHLAQALARAERTGLQIALLFCDMDGFKPINDQYGHETGDAVLRDVGARLGKGRRRSDTVARLGGDEFVILLPDLNDAATAARSVAQQCLAAVAEPFDIGGNTFVLSLSIGVALHSGPAVAPSALLSRADSALYQAKHAGKGRYAVAGDISGQSAQPLPAG